MKAKYLFYFCNGIGSVFDSQVLTLLNAISARQRFKEVYLFMGVHNEDQKRELREKNLSKEIKIIFYKYYPNYPFFNYLQRRSIFKSFKNLNLNYKEVIFHTRGELIAWHLSKILNNEYYENIISDIRGARIEEINEFDGYNILKRHLKVYNYKSALKNLNQFKKISVVSNSLKNYLVNRYQICPNQIVITSCLAGRNFNFDHSQRLQIRERLNLNDNELLIVFSSGGLANWNNPLFLSYIAEKDVKVLNLSKKNIDSKNIINKFICYNEMPLYLNAADIAIIWRDESVVNEVASPVKFSEYLCCGLPVLANKSVHLINEIISNHKIGLLKDNFCDITDSQMANLRNIKRNKVSKIGIDYFSEESIVNRYFKTYKSLNC